MTDAPLDRDKQILFMTDAARRRDERVARWSEIEEGEWASVRTAAKENATIKLNARTGSVEPAPDNDLVAAIDFDGPIISGGKNMHDVGPKLRKEKG